MLAFFGRIGQGLLWPFVGQCRPWAVYCIGPPITGHCEPWPFAG